MILDINNFSSLLEIVIVTDFAFAFTSYREFLDKVLVGRFDNSLKDIKDEISKYRAVKDNVSKRFDKITNQWEEAIVSIESKKKEVEDSIEESKTTYGFSVISLMLGLFGLLALFISGTCCHDNVLISEILWISMIVILFTIGRIYYKDFRKDKKVKMTKRNAIQVQLVLYALSIAFIWYHESFLLKTLESYLGVIQNTNIELIQNTTIVLLVGILFVHYPLYYLRMYIVIRRSNKSAKAFLEESEEKFKSITVQNDVLEELKNELPVIPNAK